MGKDETGVMVIAVGVPSELPPGSCEMIDAMYQLANDPMVPEEDFHEFVVLSLARMLSQTCEHIEHALGTAFAAEGGIEGLRRAFENAGDKPAMRFYVMRALTEEQHTEEVRRLVALETRLRGKLNEKPS